MSDLYCRVYGKRSQDVTQQESSKCASQGVYCQYCEDLVDPDIPKDMYDEYLERSS